jgi:hypothetical protein
VLTFFILLCIPSIQLGASYYASVATVSSVLVLGKWYRAALKAALTNFALMLVVASMFLSLLSYPSDQLLLDMLRIAREGLIFFFMTSLIAAFRNSRMKIDAIALQKPLFAVCLSLAIFVLVQQWFLLSGEYFGVPFSWFSLDAATLGTLPGELALYYTDVRPSGPYAEPSYLSFILISLLLMSLPLVRRSRIAIACVIFIIVAGLASRSLSFPLALALVLSSLALRLKLKDRIMIGVGASLLAAAALLTIGTGTVLSRLGEGTGDYSTSVRIFIPVLALPRFLLTYPLGVPFHNLEAALAPFVPFADASGIGNDGLFNLLFNYGILGFLMILVMLKAARDSTVGCYLVASAIFNGAFLAPDKFAVIVFSVAVYHSARKMVENSLRPQLAQSGLEGRGAAPSTAAVEASSALGIASRLRSGSI